MRVRVRVRVRVRARAQELAQERAPKFLGTFAKVHVKVPDEVLRNLEKSSQVLWPKVPRYF